MFLFWRFAKKTVPYGSPIRVLPFYGRIIDDGDDDDDDDETDEDDDKHVSGQFIINP